MTDQRGKYRIATDIGGTFTDFVYLDTADGSISIDKRLTTAKEPERAVIEGIDKWGASSEKIRGIEDFTHGTTLVINALIERKGRPTALLTTQGFEDILEIGHEVRYDAYDLNLQFPTPLVPRPWRRGIVERVHATGRILTPIDLNQVARTLDELVEEGVEAVAVSFLHSYAQNAHEKQVAELIQNRYPNMNYSLSSEILPEIKEFERVSTTVANAYTQPVIEAYLGKLQRELIARGCDGGLFVMQSAGGVLPLSSAGKVPVRMVESGPAGGVITAIEVGKGVGIADLLAFDMGGTTAKLCPVVGSEAAVTHMYEVARTASFKAGSGIPICTPVVDLLEIGTGGGSIARVDSLGLVKAGPESASSEPGPACYGLGGTEPTVTDSDMVLGYLDPGQFLGGEMTLDPGRASEAMDSIADPLGLTRTQAAAAIRDTAEETMAAAARVHLAKLGLDPSAMPIVASGGAGPVHAAGLARRLGCPQVVVPPAAGVGSALGLLLAPPAFETSRTYKAKTDVIDLEEIDRIFVDMENESANMLPEPAKGQRLVFRRWVDMRYVGQGFEVSIDLPTREDWASTNPSLIESLFRSAYENRFDRSYDDVTVEVVHLRIRATNDDGGLVGVEFGDTTSNDIGRSDPVPIGSRSAVFAGSDTPVTCGVFDRASLKIGDRIPGPAFIQERETCTVIPIGDEARIGNMTAIIIDINKTNNEYDRRTDDFKGDVRCLVPSK